MLVVRSIVFNVLFYLTLLVLMVLGLPTLLGGRRAVFALASAVAGRSPSGFWRRSAA